jgi:hypothetical protein
MRKTSELKQAAQQAVRVTATQTPPAKQVEGTHPKPPARPVVGRGKTNPS